MRTLRSFLIVMLIILACITPFYSCTVSMMGHDLWMIPIFVVMALLGVGIHLLGRELRRRDAEAFAALVNTANLVIQGVIDSGFTPSQIIDRPCFWFAIDETHRQWTVMLEGFRSPVFPFSEVISAERVVRRDINYNTYHSVGKSYTVPSYRYIETSVVVQMNNFMYPVITISCISEEEIRHILGLLQVVATRNRALPAAPYPQFPSPGSVPVIPAGAPR